MTNALTMAGRQIPMKAITGTILAFGPRPKPNADRKLCQASAATIRDRPRRGPS
jgi:hypothetical protein